MRVNGEPLQARDPLFCDPRNGHGGARQFGETLWYELASAHSPDRSSFVGVRFTELPVEDWHDLTNEEKRARGIIGGAGVSVLRADREIDFGWHFMGAKRRENYDDWWRCELTFEPELDELFGVTHNKQGITPTPRLKSILCGDLESIARTLNARVRRRFEDARSSQPTKASRVATATDRFLPPVSDSSGRQQHTKSGGQDQNDSFRYSFSTQPLTCPDFFLTERHGDTLQVTLNTNHPFFEKVYHDDRRGIRQRRQLESTLLSAARAKAVVALNDELWSRFSQAWSDALALFLDSNAARKGA